MVDILDDFDESAVGEVVGDIAVKYTRPKLEAPRSIDALIARLRALPDTCRQQIPAVVLGGKLFEVTGVTPDGMFEIEEQPF